MNGRSGGFASSLVFAAFAALITVPFLMMANSFGSLRFAVGIGCLALVVGYVFVIAPSWSRGVRTALVAAGIGIVVVVIAPTKGAAVVGTIFVIGVLRSGFLYRSRPGRALVIETLLLSVGVLLAGILASSGYAPGYTAGVLRTALAVWGFFLVQSLFFVIGGVAQRAAESDGVDPFVKAREQAMRLMEDTIS